MTHPDGLAESNANAELARRAKGKGLDACHLCAGRGTVACARCGVPWEDVREPRCPGCLDWLIDEDGHPEPGDACPECLSPDCAECGDVGAVPVLTCWGCGYVLCIVCFGDGGIHCYTCEASLPDRKWVVRRLSELVRKV